MYIPTYLPTYLPTYIHTYIHTYVYIRIIHTYTHTYIHTEKSNLRAELESFNAQREMANSEIVRLQVRVVKLGACNKVECV
jgi:hypothetical protein